MKRRIVRETRFTGVDFYVPQFRLLGFWCDYDGYSGSVAFATLSEARRFLEGVNHKATREVVEEV